MIRTIKNWFLPLSVCLASACSSGLGTAGDDVPTATAGEARASGLGIDFGLSGGASLEMPIEDDYALAGALIPGSTPDAARRIAFVAFTTAAPNQSPAGAPGESLTTDGNVMDANGETDVFLMAVEEKLESFGGRQPQPRAFSRALLSTFKHSRCVHCHGIRDNDIFPAGSGGHPGGLITVAANNPENCGGCHNTEGAALGVEWFVPLDPVADGLDFRTATNEELSARVALLDLDEHLLVDDRVRWAIDTGTIPAQGTIGPDGSITNVAGNSQRWRASGVQASDIGAVPISFQTFEDQLRAWKIREEATAASSVLAVELVSARNATGDASNGASSEPTVVWVPNESFDTGATAPVEAGRVYVAFVSDATDLTAGGSGGDADVYWRSYRVLVDPSMPDEDVIIQAFDPLRLVSAASAGNSNGPSFQPSLDGTGQSVAFHSLATNLVAGFTDGNGASAADVYVRSISGGTTALVSHAFGSLTSGGAAPVGSVDPRAGQAFEASMSFDGRFIAFTSSATDLVAEANDSTNVFVWDRDGAGALTAISRGDGGGPSSTGVSQAPAVASLGGGEFAVAFQSSATDLLDGQTTSGTQIFVGEGGVVELISRSAVGAGAPGNGSSTSPSITPSGGELAFVTEATNIDGNSSADTNGQADVALADLKRLRSSGVLSIRRINVNAFGFESTGAASAPRVGTFRDTVADAGFEACAFLTSADAELGVTSEPLVALFLGEENPDLAAAFNATGATVAESSLTVDFQDLSRGEPETWLWNFDVNGSGPTSTLQNPSFTYGSPGDYAVSLTVTRAAGGETSVETKTAFVTILEPLTVTGVSIDNGDPQTDANITFTPTFSREPDAGSAAFAWDFGSVSASPLTSTSRVPTMSYGAAGTFDADFTVTDAFSNLAPVPTTTQVTVRIADGASFNVTGENGLEFTFASNSTGSPTALAWDFSFSGSQGNPGATFNNEGSSASITNRYGNNGVRTVALRATYAGTGDTYAFRSIDVDAIVFSAVQPLLTSNCSGCHVAGALSSGLPFDGNAASVYASLVDVNKTSNIGGCTAAGSKRVDPYSSGNSFLFSVANGASCSMASFGSSTQRTTLQNWINQGAAEN